MIVYRLCKAAHIALDGKGARLWGGRWNSADWPMVYTAATPSLAVLEILVHLDLCSLTTCVICRSHPKLLSP